MNILITGATGLLGKKMVEVLSEQHKVFAIVKPGSSKFIERKNIYFIEKDLAKFELNNFPNNIDTVYYLAQSRKFREFPEEVIDIFEVNVSAPLKIIKWAIDNGVKNFYYTSSGGVYRNPKKPVKEFFSINANEKNGFYLDSKLAAEILLKNFSKFFRSFIILRPFFIYGPRQDKTMLIPRIISNVIYKKPIYLNGDEGIKLNPIFIEDAASALKNLLNLDGEYIFNIAGSEVVTIKKLAEIVGSTVKIEPVFKNINEFQFDLIADISLMKNKLHNHNISLKDGIKLTYEFFKIYEEFNSPTKQ